MVGSTGYCGGVRWDDAVEEALHASPCLLVVLSSASVNSDNVKDEISFGLDNHTDNPLSA